MLDFPNNPAVDEVFENWKWDGVRWLCVGGGGGGASRMGVTDGSLAAPGMVGEIVTGDGQGDISVAAIPGVGYAQNIGSIGAGDWDVFTQIAIEVPASPPANAVMWTEIGVGGTDVTEAITLVSLAGRLAYLLLYPVNGRINRSVVGPVINGISVSIQNWPGTANFHYTWQFTARRMR